MGKFRNSILDAVYLPLYYLCSLQALAVTMKNSSAKAPQQSWCHRGSLLLPICLRYLFNVTYLLLVSVLHGQPILWTVQWKAGEKT